MADAPSPHRIKLVTVLVGIGLLIAVVLLWPATGTARHAALRNRCKEHMRIVFIQLRDHLEAHDSLPTDEMGSFSLSGLAGSAALCPSGTAYVLNPHITPSAFWSRDQDAPVLCDRPEAHRDSENSSSIFVPVLFADGHVEPVRFETIDDFNHFIRTWALPRVDVLDGVR